MIFWRFGIGFAQNFSESQWGAIESVGRIPSQAASLFQY
jgi:hypothetical protein